MAKKNYLSQSLCQGGNFHLKVGGAKSSGNAGDPLLGVAVSGGYNPTTRWEVVKNRK